MYNLGCNYPRAEAQDRFIAWRMLLYYTVDWIILVVLRLSQYRT